MKLVFSRQFLEKFSNTNCNENSSGGSQGVPCGRTDRVSYMTKPIVAFRKFANAPKTASDGKRRFECRKLMRRQILKIILIL
jgi:hypothetical protein